MYNKNFQKYYWVNPINFTNNLIGAAKIKFLLFISDFFKLIFYESMLKPKQKQNKKQNAAFIQI